MTLNQGYLGPGYSDFEVLPKKNLNKLRTLRWVRIYHGMAQWLIFPKPGCRIKLGQFWADFWVFLVSNIRGVTQNHFLMFFLGIPTQNIDFQNFENFSAAFGGIFSKLIQNTANDLKTHVYGVLR